MAVIFLGGYSSTSITNQVNFDAALLSVDGTDTSNNEPVNFSPIAFFEQITRARS